MLPIFTTLLAAVPGLLNTGLSLIKDKKAAKFVKNVVGIEEIFENKTDFVDDSISKGVSLSSKRVLNIAGTGFIISIAIGDITKNGITQFNLALLGLGVVYSIAMTLITYLSERKA